MKLRINGQSGQMRLLAGCLAGILLIMVFGCGHQPFIQVLFDVRHGLQTGDRVLMNDVPVGQVTDVSLRTSRTSVVKVIIEDRYRTLLNSSTVFTFISDPGIKDRNCLICKNCNESAAPIISGHEFQGMGILRYSLTCLSRQFEESAGSSLQNEFRRAVESGEEMSTEVLRLMENLAVTNHEAFEQMLLDASEWVDRLDAEARETIEELREVGKDNAH